MFEVLEKTILELRADVAALTRRIEELECSRRDSASRSTASSRSATATSRSASMQFGSGFIAVSDGSRMPPEQVAEARRAFEAAIAAVST